MYFAIGSCSDAWELRCVGDPEDVIDHRPYTADGNKTPVGYCTDAPVLILYPERGKFIWENLLGLPLLGGSLLSGAKIKTVYLFDEDWKRIKKAKTINIEEIRELALKSPQALQENIQKAQQRGYYKEQGISQHRDYRN